jgi:hypothetical protein
LTYTLRITNMSDITLHGIVTDVLPANVKPTGMLTWTAVIPALGEPWVRQVAVTVAMDYVGPLTNTVLVSAVEGAMGIYTETVAAVGPLASIVIVPNPVTVTVGTTQTFTASGADAWGNPMPVVPAWTTGAGAMTGNTLTARTTPANGKHVTATLGAVSGTAIVNVVTGPLASIMITPTAVTLAMRQSRQFGVSGFDSFSNAISGFPQSWVVTPSDVGTIDADGLYTAGTKAGVYAGAVIVSSGMLSSSADVIVRWPYQAYLPVVVRQLP